MKRKTNICWIPFMQSTCPRFSTDTKFSYLCSLIYRFVGLLWPVSEFVCRAKQHHIRSRMSFGWDARTPTRRHLPLSECSAVRSCVGRVWFCYSAVFPLEADPSHCSACHLGGSQPNNKILLQASQTFRHNGEGERMGEDSLIDMWLSSALAILDLELLEANNKSKCIYFFPLSSQKIVRFKQLKQQRQKRYKQMEWLCVM